MKKSKSQIECLACGERMLFLKEETSTFRSLWYFSEDGTAIRQELPLSVPLELQSQNPTELKIENFLVCPTCGAKYECSIQQVGTMKALVQRGKRII